MKATLGSTNNVINESSGEYLSGIGAPTLTENVPQKSIHKDSYCWYPRGKNAQKNT